MKFLHRYFGPIIIIIVVASMAVSGYLVGQGVNADSQVQRQATLTLFAKQQYRGCLRGLDLRAAVNHLLRVLHEQTLPQPDCKANLSALQKEINADG